MGKRGPQSSEALTIAQSAQIDAVQRPDAPYDLTDDEAGEWWAVVNRLPADWFQRETHPLLAQYCRHVVRARCLSQLINKVQQSKEFDLKEYRYLLQAEEEQSRAISALARSMRISQQATYDKTRKKPPTTLTLKPWEKGD